MALLGNLDKLNKDIEKFSQVFPVTEDMNTTYEGVSRMIMLDRYSFKDTKHETLGAGDLVVFTSKPDPDYPTRAIGTIVSINKDKGIAIIEI